MSTANDIRQTFFQECDELLEALDDGLSEIDDGIADATFSIDTVNAVFRAVHSIKGGAAAFGLDALVHFAHQFETVLDAMRSGQLQATEEGMKICHRAADHLNDLVAAGRENRELDAGSGPDIAARLAGLVAMPESAPAPTPPVSGKAALGSLRSASIWAPLRRIPGRPRS
ncbi:Hpt domain-containing protein [Seohaeicola zhoushanensis]